jgi:3alpha(or 20beta)-hydroxysteroid dehydrogenase
VTDGRKANALRNIDMSFPGLSNKVAIVTGAAGGIGAAAVDRLVEEGAKVVAVDIRFAELSQIAARHDGKVLAHAADVSSEADCEGYVRAAVEKFGGVNLFVNNAAIVGKRVRLVDLPVADFDRVCAINLRGVFLGLQMVIRQMLKQGKGGSIVNTASIGALRAHRNSSDYGTTKHAVTGLSKVAALEYGHDGIRVNAICPGPVDTSMLRPALQTTDNDLTSYFVKDPIPRMAEPREIANFIAYLLSDEASFQTGGVYAIDGGRSA